MVPFWAVAVLAGTSLVAVLLMLAVRRYWAPEGFLGDPVPPAGVFGVLGVAFAVLLAFVLFMAFEGYVRAHDGASREAVAVTQLLRTASLMPEQHDEKLRDDLVCYARAVVSDEWPKMASGHESARVADWVVAIETTVNRIPVDNARTEVALGSWLEEMTERREGRRARLAESSSSMPSSVWLILILGAVSTVLYLVVFADRRERWWVQGVMMGTITGLVVSSLLVIHFLDHPFTPDGAYIPPDEMIETLQLYENEVPGNVIVTLPCDEQGRPA
jgi:multisubunit Na+/H+ antiporter MnhB subunit